MTEHLVTGIFHNREDAEQAYADLRNKGYAPDEINLIMSEDTRTKHFSDRRDTEMGTKAMEGLGTGATIGGAVGAAAGIIAAIGTSLIIPGLGIIVAGPLAAGLAGAGAGGITGGLIGALIGSGIPEEHAKSYEQGIKKGGIVVTVRPRSEADARMIEHEWQSHHAGEVHIS
jgi:hypothetical protein